MNPALGGKRKFLKTTSKLCGGYCAKSPMLGIAM